MALDAAFCRTIFNGFSVRGARKSHAELNSDHTTSCGVFRGCPGMRNAVREPARVESTPTPASEAARDYLTQWAFVVCVIDISMGFTTKQRRRWTAHKAFLSAVRSHIV